VSGHRTVLKTNPGKKKDYVQGMLMPTNSCLFLFFSFVNFVSQNLLLLSLALDIVIDLLSVVVEPPPLPPPPA